METNQITAEQIAAWKKSHGNVHMVEGDGCKCYLREPDRAALSAASAIGQTNPIKYGEVLLENCWLGGDEIMKIDDSYFLSVVARLSALIKTKEVTIKKL